MILSSRLTHFLTMLAFFAILGGVFFCAAAGIIHSRYNSDKAQDLSTTGVVVSKWTETIRSNRGSSKKRNNGTRTYYKMGVIYALDADQNINSNALKKVEKHHRRALRTSKVNPEQFAELAEHIAKSKGTEVNRLLYLTTKSRKKYSETNINDDIRFEYVSDRPWDLKFSLASARKSVSTFLWTGLLLFLLGTICYFIRAKIDEIM